MPDTAKELTSWKQIASYLGVNVRTAQKWERERGLPVRRLPGGRGRVTIDTSALEQWKHARPALPTEGSVFRWPVDHDVIAEVRFVGPPTLTSVHIQRLLDYLSLMKTALE
jgi:excisionase family DNA binding protein